MNEFEQLWYEEIEPRLVWLLERPWIIVVWTVVMIVLMLVEVLR